ncbi:hypothetical protein [Bradyrhizobium oropedii]|uniref:hypothetical protein n=1 Tax=Bradyrhizobium oropedii TaxID=1571201 RepID=UPI00308410F3
MVCDVADPGSVDGAAPRSPIIAEIARRPETGLDPGAVAAQVLAAIRDDRFYIFTHPGRRAEVEERFSAILAAMDTVSAQRPVRMALFLSAKRR